MHLGALDRLYASVEAQLGTDRLDSVLAAGDLDALEDVLAGFLGKLRNVGMISGEVYQTYLAASCNIFRFLTASSMPEVSLTVDEPDTTDHGHHRVRCFD